MIKPEMQTPASAVNAGVQKSVDEVRPEFDAPNIIQTEQSTQPGCCSAKDDLFRLVISGAAQRLQINMNGFITASNNDPSPCEEDWEPGRKAFGECLKFFAAQVVSLDRWPRYPLGSYDLKHTSERVCGSYHPNGVLILAAIASGIEWKRSAHGINAVFKADFREAQPARRDNHG